MTRNTHTQTHGNPDSPIVLVQPVDDHDLEEMEAEVSEIQRLTSMDFCRIAVKVRSWNQDLSPWKAPAVFGNQDFGNGAADFLRNITELCSDPHKTYYLGGYSLAGLFCLSDRSVLRDCGSIAVCLVSRIFRLRKSPQISIFLCLSKSR